MFGTILRSLFATAFCAAAPAVAQTVPVGDWLVSTQSDSTLFAATINDSGALFGQFCYLEEGTCAWLLGMTTGCEKGDKYPALLNSDRGARSVEIYCDGKLESGLYRYAFTDFDAVKGHLIDSARIGIAIPLQSDQFRVVRFSLDGAARAISSMRDAAEARATPAKRGTRDQVL